MQVSIISLKFCIVSFSQFSRLLILLGWKLPMMRLMYKLSKPPQGNCGDLSSLLVLSVKALEPLA